MLVWFFNVPRDYFKKQIFFVFLFKKENVYLKKQKVQA